MGGVEALDGDPWDLGDGVLVLPSGRRVRGRSLRRGAPEGPLPTYGVYLTGRPPSATEWPQTWIRWRDFGLPADRPGAIDVLSEALDRAATGRVEVACGGGRGRTGTALAVLCVLDGLTPDDALELVRSGYDRRAVETSRQRRWVRSMPSA